MLLGVIKRELWVQLAELRKRQYDGSGWISADHLISVAGHLRFDFRLYFYNIGIVKSTDAVTSLAALAQESRLALFRLLVKRGPEGYTPTELSEKLDVPAPTLSFHLKELQHAGLIEFRRNGRYLFYSPNFTHMDQLLEFLTDHCCSLADRSCGSICAPASADGRKSRLS